MRWSRSPRIPSPVSPGGELLRAERVSVMLGGRTIIEGVDLALHAGELVVLVGPNGAGKSTLFGALAGELPAHSGNVFVYGALHAAWSNAELALRRAVLPQHVTVTFPFLARDIVEMGRAPWTGTSRDASGHEIVGRALDQAGIAHLAMRQFPTLSGGERARVAVARVLAQDCQALLLDEPTAALDLHHQEVLLQCGRGVAAPARAALDLHHQEVLLQVVRRQVAAGKGALLVLHDLALAAAYADRVAVIADGRIAADGAPRDVLTPALLSEVYRHDIEVIAHPETGDPLVIPRRPASAG